MASRAQAAFFMLLVLCLNKLEGLQAPTASVRATTKLTTPRPQSTVTPSTRHYSSTLNPYSTYHMDSISQCSSFTNYMGTVGSSVTVTAWSYRPSPSTAQARCQMTFSTTYDSHFKFRFSKSFSQYMSSSCGVKLNIYASSSSYGTRKYQYTCGDTLPSSFRTINSDYITVVLQNSNPARQYNFDFTMTITSEYDHHSDSWGAILGGVLGGVFVLCLVTGLICRRRVARRRYGRLTNPIIINASAATATYPTGTAPYPTGSAPYPNTTPYQGQIPPPQSAAGPTPYPSTPANPPYPDQGYPQPAPPTYNQSLAQEPAKNPPSYGAV